jgi:hypothetical protein
MGDSDKIPRTRDQVEFTLGMTVYTSAGYPWVTNPLVHVLENWSGQWAVYVRGSKRPIFYPHGHWSSPGAWAQNMINYLNELQAHLGLDRARLQRVVDHGGDVPEVNNSLRTWRFLQETVFEFVDQEG